MTILDIFPEDRARAIELLGKAYFGDTWQVRVADVLGVSRVTVYRWISGDRVPDERHVLTLRRLAAERIRSIAYAFSSISVLPYERMDIRDYDIASQAASAARSGSWDARTAFEFRSMDDTVEQYELNKAQAQAAVELDA